MCQSRRSEPVKEQAKIFDDCGYLAMTKQPISIDLSRGCRKMNHLFNTQEVETWRER